jgi:hypothetical protein
MRKAFIALLFFIPSIAFASPDPFTNTVSTIIAQTSDKYCVIEYTNDNKGFHHAYDEYFYMVWKEIGTDKELSRYLIKSQSVTTYDGKKDIKGGQDIKIEKSKYEPVVPAFPFWKLIKIENNELIISDGYRDDPTEYEIKIDLKENLGEIKRAEVISVMESDNAYYFYIRIYKSYSIETTVVFSILKSDYYDLIP